MNKPRRAKRRFGPRVKAVIIVAIFALAPIIGYGIAVLIWK